MEVAESLQYCLFRRYQAPNASGRAFLKGRMF